MQIGYGIIWWCGLPLLSPLLLCPVDSLSLQSHTASGIHPTHAAASYAATAAPIFMGAPLCILPLSVFRSLYAPPEEYNLYLIGCERGAFRVWQARNLEQNATVLSLGSDILPSAIQPLSPIGNEVDRSSLQTTKLEREREVVCSFLFVSTIRFYPVTELAKKMLARIFRQVEAEVVSNSRNRIN